MTPEEKQLIIDKLQTIVDKQVKFFKEDFQLDVKNIIEKKNDLPMVFLARECGTVLISFNGVEDYTAAEVFNYCKEACKVIEYYVFNDGPKKVKLYTIKDGKVKGLMLYNYARAERLIREAETRLLTKIARRLGKEAELLSCIF